METIQPISLCNPCIISVRCPNNVRRAMQTDRSNIVVLRFGDHGTKEMLGVNVGWKVWPVSDFVQQHTTISNNMQQGVQMDATWNIQQCCVHLHGALEISRQYLLQMYFEQLFFRKKSLGRRISFMSEQNIICSQTQAKHRRTALRTWIDHNL